MTTNEPRPRPSLAIDMDDVIVDFVGGLLEAVWREFGVRIDPETIKEWNIRPILDPIIGYNWWTWLREHEWLWAQFPAIPGAIGSIDRLNREGWDLEIITVKPDWARHNVWRWLGKWRPSVSRVTILNEHGQGKQNFSNADFLIDDKPQHCEDWAATGRQALLFTQWHNRSYKANRKEGITRVGDWPHALDLLERLNNGR